MFTLLGVAVMVSVSFYQMNRQQDWVAHTYEVIDSIQTVLSDMKDVQSAQRGYLITGANDYLQPYHVALEKMPGNMNELQSLIEDNDQQLARFYELSEHVQKRIVIAQDMIGIYNDRGQAAAFAKVKIGSGKHEMDYIRAITQEMINQEQHLLDARRHDMSVYTQGTIYAGVIALVACFIILMAVFYQINRETLANLELQKALREQSIRDVLTGLYNRRYMEEMMEREIARAQRAKDSLAILILDIDFFKKINDTYGHDGGDTVLKHFASLLNARIRKEDIACRMGGEEFLIVMPGIGEELAKVRAKELCHHIRSLTIPVKGQDMTITSSIGVAILPSHGSTGHDLITAADAALYHAKKNGRDQVVIYQSDMAA